MKLADSWVEEASTFVQPTRLYDELDELDEYDEVDESKDGCGVCDGGSTCLKSLARATRCCINWLEQFGA